MADTGCACWLRSAKWFETKNGERSSVETDRSACTFIGCGTAIIRKGFNTVAEVKEYTNRKGVKTYVVKCTLAQYDGNYCHLISWGDNQVSRTITKLEKGDRVFLCGKEVTYPYTNRKNERIVISEIEPHFIISMGHTEAVETMYMNPSIQMLLNGQMPNMDERPEEEEFETEAPYSEEEWEQEEEFDLETDEFEEPDPMETPWR